MQKLSYPQYLLPFLGFFEGLLLDLYNFFFLLYLSYSVFKEQKYLLTTKIDIRVFSGMQEIFICR